MNIRLILFLYMRSELVDFLNGRTEMVFCRNVNVLRQFIIILCRNVIIRNGLQIVLISR